jgi:hypothetical protein
VKAGSNNHVLMSRLSNFVLRHKARAGAIQGHRQKNQGSFVTVVERDHMWQSDLSLFRRFQQRGSAANATKRSQQNVDAANTSRDGPHRRFAEGVWDAIRALIPQRPWYCRVWPSRCGGRSCCVVLFNNWPTYCGRHRRELCKGVRYQDKKDFQGEEYT